MIGSIEPVELVVRHAPAPREYSFSAGSVFQVLVPFTTATEITNLTTQKMDYWTWKWT